MARELKDIYWLAGIIEGEGCLGVMRKANGRGTFYIAVKMNDKDIVWRAKTILNTDSFYIIDGSRNSNSHAYFETRVHGKQAIGWMMTLFPLMGVRRRIKIKDTLIEWRARKAWSRSVSNFMKNYAARQV